MRLMIDPLGGMAGDMFSAALISAGADFTVMRRAMLAAAEKLGSASITREETADGACRLDIALHSRAKHLAGAQARKILADVCGECGVGDVYRDFAFTVLDILLKAEIKAHRDFNIVISASHEHDHHAHDHGHDHEHDHHHHRPAEAEDGAFLHEAQDIVIDIMGAVMGLQLLGVEPRARLLAPVSVGGGTVEFSHGTLPVPAPATKIILEQYAIAWQAGPLPVELATPTGVSILAGLSATAVFPGALAGKKIVAGGLARGGKLLDIPPLKIVLVD